MTLLLKWCSRLVKLLRCSEKTCNQGKLQTKFEILKFSELFSKKAIFERSRRKKYISSDILALFGYVADVILKPVDMDNF